MIKNLPAMQETQVGKSPWGRKWQPTPVFLPEEFNGQKILVGYSPWGYKESDTTEQLSLIDYPVGSYRNTPVNCFFRTEPPGK